MKPEPQDQNQDRLHEKITLVTDTANSAKRIRVFVHLARSFGLAAWQERWDAGRILGINHRDPYGYQQAVDMGCDLSQSEDPPENAFQRLLRLGLRAILGFDLAHAWSNRHGIFNAEVVWTHTESQALAVLLLMRLKASAKQPKLIAQTVWMVDDWKSYAASRRWFYAKLLERADVLTVHSMSALRELRRLFPASRSELVRYGIRADQPLNRQPRPIGTPIHVLTLGNDRHRDWPVFVAAVRDRPELEGKMLTRMDVAGLVAGVTNLEVMQPANNQGLIDLYGWADVVVVCLTDNFHASGITVIQEAVLLGVPVVCSDCGDLQSYFSADEVLYVTPHDPSALRDAILSCRRDQLSANERAARALSRMKSGNINSCSFVAQHVALSRELLGLPANPEVC